MVLAVMFGAGDHATLAIIAFVAGLTGFCLPFIRAKVVKGKQISQFASANNMSYSMGISAAFNTRMKGMFANSNSIENAVVTEVLHSTADPFSELGNIQFSIVRADLGLHREIDTIHTWGFAKVTLPNSLPHIILDSLTNDMFGLGSLPGSLDKKQRLSLEGELDTKFALYAPLDYATDAYYIFPPSVLIQFTNLSQPYDIEIIEDAMYIYRHNKFDLGNPQDIQEATWIAATLKQIILTKAKKYNDTFKDILTDEQRSREGQNLQT